MFYTVLEFKTYVWVQKKEKFFARNKISFTVSSVLTSDFRDFSSSGQHKSTLIGLQLQLCIHIRSNRCS